MGLFWDIVNERKSDVNALDKASSVYDQLLDVPEYDRELNFDSDQNLLWFNLSDVEIEVDSEVTIQYKLIDSPENQASAEILSYDDTDDVDIRFYPKKSIKHHTLMTLGVNSVKLMDYFFDNIGFLIPRDLFVHEFAHYLDKGLGLKRSSNYGEYSEDYFNDFNEIQAYLIQNFDNYKDMISDGTYQTFEEFYKDFIEEIEDMWGYLTDENKKRVNKRIYSFWNEYNNG